MPTIIEIDIESSAIDRVGYDEQARQLYVRFRNGGAYTYLAVPPDVWLALSEAESKGTFVNTVIKPRYEVRDGAPI